MGPVLFSIFISDPEVEMECALVKIMDNTKLMGAIDSLRAIIQSDVDKLEEWPDRTSQNSAQPNAPGTD